MSHDATVTNSGATDLNAHFVVNCFDTSITITNTSDDADESQSNSIYDVDVEMKKMTTKLLPFMQNAFDRLNKMTLNALFGVENNYASNWKGPHSGLIMTSRGSGKSQLLSCLISSINGRFQDIIKANSEDCLRPLFVFNLTGKLCELSTVSMETKISITEEFKSNRSYQIYSLVSFLVNVLVQSDYQVRGSHDTACENVLKYFKSTGKLPSICLVIDDIDSLISASEDLASLASNATDTNFVSLQLQKLLAFLSDPLCCEPICLVATTSITVQADVLSVFCGPPGFDITVTLPIPNFVDRCFLLKHFLRLVCNQDDADKFFGNLPYSFATSADIDDLKICGEDKETLASGINQHILNWISRAASMTAGYLPADLKIIIKRALGMASDRGVPPTHEEVHANVSSEAFADNCQLLWTDFLKALAATMPSQLRSVESTESGTGGIVVESRNNLLTWNDFAGYSAQKKLISEVLLRTNPSYANKSSHAHRIRDSVGHSDLRKAISQQMPRGMILWGPSGCGKSYMARIIAAEVSSAVQFYSLHS